MANITRIDQASKTVYFDDNTSIDFKGFINVFRSFMKGRIAGESLYPADMERFMRRTSAKNLSLLMKGKKSEGFHEAQSGKKLTRGQKIAIGTVVMIVFVGIFAFVILKSQGVF